MTPKVVCTYVRARGRGFELAQEGKVRLLPYAGHNLGVKGQGGGETHFPA